MIGQVALSAVWLALLALPGGVTGAAHPTPRGTAPLRVDCTGDAELCRDAAVCGDCHPDEYAAWQGSRHRAAWNNHTFQYGFARDPKRFCFHCHAPLETDWRYFAAHRTDAKSEGINCQVCHLAELAPGAAPTRTDDHPIRPTAELRDPAFCARCHEFDLIERRGGEMVSTGLPLQTTYTEWKAYRAAGGAGTCQSCHMPGGDHRFRGAHDLAFFRAALTFTVDADDRGWRVSLTNAGIGHNLPSGDIFRRLVIEHVDHKGQRRPLASFERRFDVKWDESVERFVQVLASNTSLRPGQTGTARLPADARGRVRVIYYWAGRPDEGEPPVVLFEKALDGA